MEEHDRPTECESCNGKITRPNKVFGMWLCEDCIKREIQAKLEQNPRELGESILESIRATPIQNPIKVKSDVYNAEIESISEIKARIDLSDEPNKLFKLASEVQEHINSLKTVIFDLNEKIQEENVKIRASKDYLNELSNKLRSEEREKLRLQDNEYKPKPATIKRETIKKANKPDKTEVRKYAAELGISEFVLQMLCIQKGISPEKAANELRRSINEAKSME